MPEGEWNYVTWTASLVGDDGMEIRRDSVEARVEINEGRIVFPGGGSGATGNNTVSVGGITFSKNELPYTTVTVDELPVLGVVPLMLPDGAVFTAQRKMNCQCLVCQTARGETMDRDQVARVAAQIGSSLMPDNSQWMNRFTVESTSSSRVYTVAQRRSDNVWGCSCPAWINRRHCKHLDDILERLATLTQFDVTDPAVLEMLRSARTAYLDLDASTSFPVAKAPTYRRHIDL